MEFRYEPEADARELIRWPDADHDERGILLTAKQVVVLRDILAASGEEQRARVRRSLERALGELDSLLRK